MTKSCHKRLRRWPGWQPHSYWRRAGLMYSAWLEFANEPSSCLEDAEPTKPPAPTPVDNMELVGNGCCRFDGWKASNKGYRSVDACKKLCTEDAAS